MDKGSSFLELLIVYLVWVSLSHEAPLVIFPKKLMVDLNKTTVVLLDSDKSHNEVVVGNEKGQSKLDKTGAYVDLKAKDKAASKVKIMPKEELDARFSKVLAMSPAKPIGYILYLQKNSMALTEASKLEFQKALKSIEKYSPCMVDVIGHTDTVGSNAINLKVSLKRAESIKLLIEESKIKIFSLVAKGYGEEDLLVQTKNNKAEAKNRNVEIFIK